ncbi:MAG: VanZ family protein [Coriobacteriia bacterium]|nr:VanZ family protein [Coriobacteriia bacterium]
MADTTSADNAGRPTPARYPLWVLCACWAGVIFWFSTKPGTQIPGRFSEIGHLGEYFIFGLLLYAALRASGWGARAASVALITASLYGITDEFHQHFVYMRTPDVTDWGTDTIGAALGILALFVAGALRRRRHNALSPSQPD